MESSTLLSQCYYSPSAFLPHLNKTRTGFLHLQPQKQLPPSSSSSLQIKPKSFSTTRRIVPINSGTYSLTDVNPYSGTFSLTDAYRFYNEDESEYPEATEVADEDRENLWVKITMMRDRFGAVPGLATIPVGNVIESQSYLTLKKTCEIVGVKLHEAPLPHDSTEEQLLNCANRFRQDPCVHYIVIPTPIPHHMDGKRILDALSFTPGRGGFHTTIEYQNMQVIDPSSADYIKRYIKSDDLKGKRVAVMGCSNIFANIVRDFHEIEPVSVSNIRVSEIDNCKYMIKKADVLIDATIIEGHALYRLTNPEGLFYSVDTIPEQTLAQRILNRTFLFAYRMLEQPQS